MDLHEIETLLDAGKLEIAMRNGNYWTLRRNGATKLWKRDVNRFRIPFKAGLKSCGAIDSTESRTLEFYGIRVKEGK
jgi:hypothetical protein